MRIRLNADVGDQEDIDSAYITAIDLVSLPDKKAVASLLPNDDAGTTFGEITLLWSSDSKWCAFYYAQPRIGYTSVFQKIGNAFKLATQPEKLIGHVKGDVRNEYIKPTKWIKPGVLELEQNDVMRGEDASDVNLQLTAGMKNGKFGILSQKKMKAAE